MRRCFSPLPRETDHETIITARRPCTGGLRERSGTYRGNVAVNDAAKQPPTVIVPEDASGKSIHVILELHDNGEPRLYAYRRVIINVE